MLNVILHTRAQGCQLKKTLLCPILILWSMDNRIRRGGGKRVSSSDNYSRSLVNIIVVFHEEDHCLQFANLFTLEGLGSNDVFHHYLLAPDTKSTSGQFAGKSHVYTKSTNKSSSITF